jgi:hypothetical protein
MDSGNIAFKFNISALIGSNTANILRIIKGYKIDLKYYPKFLLTFIIALFFEIINLAEVLVYKKNLKKLRTEEPPVFIIGFWRSGTTLLHSLLCRDPHVGYVTTFQGIFPNLVLTGNRWLKAFTNRILPRKRPFDSYPMDMDFPQEEEFAMMSIQARSFYRLFYFPKDFNDIYEKELHFERLPAVTRKRWEKEYIKLINKAMLNTGGIRYISKNPCNIFRIRTLTNLFPDARFIFIYRNPYPVVESLCRFVNEVLPGSELQHLEGGLQREKFAKLYKDAIDEYLIAKENIMPGNLMEIKYEEFIKQPAVILRDLYARLNIPGIKESLPLMESYLRNNHPETRKPYEILAETYQLVNRYAGDIVPKLGYKYVESAK